MGSIPEKGSSKRINAGDVARERAISVRRRSPPREGIGRCPREVGNVQFVEEVIQPFPPFRLAQGEGFQDSHQILFDRQPAEDRRFLGEKSYSTPGALVDRESGNFLAIQEDTTTVCLYKAKDHIKRGRLPCAVRSQEPYHLPRPNRETYPGHNLSSLEGLYQLLGTKTLLRTVLPRPDGTLLTHLRKFTSPALTSALG